MARSSVGRTVARAGATGGGATYRGQVPINWYVALVVIALLGIASVALAKYHYVKGTPTVPPIIGQTWHAALQTDICGVTEPALASTSSSSTVGLTSAGGGVLEISPKVSGEAGTKATLGKFASEYSGMKLTNKELEYPGASTATSGSYKNGQVCPKGTPDAGKHGVLMARTWTLGNSTKSGKVINLKGGTTTRSPADLRFVNRQLISLGFVPANTKLPKVAGLTEVALLQALAGTSPVATTTTTAPVSSSTTTSTPAGSTTTSTTAATTTTTAPKSSTTTTAK
ncbi:MAG TPA: hypothetical protein VL961_02965 [Acidimicrobiales bacterium]|nr:hypothetical protein [Acidimicrobiales bacterium]